MKRFTYFAGAALLALGCFAGYTPAQNSQLPAGKIVVPESSIVRPQDAGKRAHTNIEIFVPAGENRYWIVPGAASRERERKTPSRAITIAALIAMPLLRFPVSAMTPPFPCTVEWCIYLRCPRAVPQRKRGRSPPSAR